MNATKVAKTYDVQASLCLSATWLLLAQKKILCIAIGIHFWLSITKAKCWINQDKWDS